MAVDLTTGAATKIVESFTAFQSGNLAVNAADFFVSLGYRSNKTYKLAPRTPTALLELAKQSKFFNVEKAHTDEWKTVDFLFQITDEEIQNFGRSSFQFDSTIDVRSEKQIDSYIFFAVDLKKNSYTRTTLADITREINRLFPMPALVLFKHGETLTLSIINRRIHKRDTARDVLEKVTLIKDINIKRPHRGHIEILSDLALPQLIAEHKVTNFVQLEDAWRNTLDTSVLNKRFYKELANWYFWALEQVEFPKQAAVDDEINRATNVIRLITRLIFVWFLKELRLVPEALFDRATLGDLLNDLAPEKSTFYKAILQNLFFATLNTPMNDPNSPRMFRSETNGQRFNDQYMVHNQFRYQKLFRDPERALEIFAAIPFLNGGLFECLDKQEEVLGKLIETRVDGFSDVRTKQPTVPNKLFFGDEEQIDLNETYATRGKRYVVRGLVHTLNRYKFTIAENTPIEEEVALDPELLGKVFENLLANYNPETGATARKQTGSFYTPREIVNYMVDESLIAYFETQLKTADHDDNLSERLRQLFAYTDEPHHFSAVEVDRLIAAIDAVKILDPACGSGAFPMGILQRLVFILAKLDPKNAKWEQRQKDRVHELIRAAERIEDHKFRENTLADLTLQIANIEEAFKRNELDYGRKLFLIENCIYGVDIQPIAIQIAKLRFFISLIIDQRIRQDAENLGIRPLPNLETRFIAANTLISLEKPAQSLLRNTAIDEKERELKIVRQNYFTARTTQTKEKFRKDDERLRREIGTLLESGGNFPHETTEKLVAWNPYDQNASAEFFDSEWMFGVIDGFAIAIGNPPYGLVNKRQNKHTSIVATEAQLKIYKSSPEYAAAAGGVLNIFRLFILRSITLLAKDGFLSELCPLALTADVSASALRKHILQRHSIHSIEAFPERDNINKRVFEAVKMSICIINLRKSHDSDSSFLVRINRDRFVDLGSERVSFTQATVAALDRNNYSIPLVTSGELAILLKTYQDSARLSDFGHCFTGEIDLTACKKYLTSDPNNAQLIKGAIIDRYLLRKEMSQGEIEFLKREKYLAENAGEKASHYKYPRIVMQAITGVNERTRLKMAVIAPETFCANSVNYIVLKDLGLDSKFLLGLLNSNLMNFVFSRSSTNSNVNGYEIDNLPIRVPDRKIQNEVAKHVGRILTAKAQDETANTEAIERVVDQLVYALFDLNNVDIKIVEDSLARS